MLRQRLFGFGLIIVLALGLSACEGQFEWLSGEYRTVVAPPAKTLAAKGGQAAQTQAARLLQTGQARVATDTSNLKETAKVEAATLAAGVIDTAQARLVTQSAGQVTAGPTEFFTLKETAEALFATQAADKLPFIQTQAARLRLTTEAHLATDTAGRFPMSLTQAASFLATAQAGAAPGGTLPPDLLEQSRDLAATLQAGLSSTPQPAQSPAIVPTSPSTTLVIYHARQGDSLASIASRFDIPAERLLRLNEVRFPWLAASAQALTPGLSLVVLRQPDNALPVQPPAQAAWSNVPGCDVTLVDWLAPPIDCQEANIDIVTQIEMTGACIALENPLGYTLTHEVVRGWMLTGVDGSYSYGWFVDRDRQVVIVGPALVSARTSYTECRKPSR
jgi:LysM repeat protein